MDWFSEKFIEDCVAEAPEAFLGRKVWLRSQQPKLGGFVPDLVFIDEFGASLIVEVQKDALDRYHLYKCLEYRDLLAAHDGGAKPEIILICETFADRYKSIVATHNVAIHVFSKEKILEMAVGNCPQSLNVHLLKSLGRSASTPKLVEEAPRRYAWCKYDSLVDAYGFISCELGRCGLWSKVEEATSGSDIIWTVRSILKAEHDFKDLLDPVLWRIDNLIAKPSSWIPPHLENLTRIRKPRATFEVFETSKGNLSARWYPSEAKPWDNCSVHDWVEAPETEPYAYQRPANELVFVKDIRRLSTDADQYMHLPDGDERAAINTMLLALIWAAFRHIQVILSKSVDLEVLSEFQLVTGKPASSRGLTERYDIVGWRIISTRDLRIEQAKERISSFSKRNNVDIDIVIKVLEEQTKIRKRSGEYQIAHVAKALRTKGYKITVIPIRQLFSDLELVSDPAYLACIAFASSTSGGGHSST